jgi:hypothetical protein
MPEVRPWARVAGDVNVGVRRGAWYEVVRLTQDAAWLDVVQRTLSVPRDSLEIVTARPDLWSVVTRPYDAVDLPVKWGSRYAVCPRCSRRAAVPEGASEMQCLGCESVFGLRPLQAASDGGPFDDSLR